MIRGLDGLDGDVVEVAPPFDPRGSTVLVGAAMMFEIHRVLARLGTAAITDRAALNQLVIPAKAGIQFLDVRAG